MRLVTVNLYNGRVVPDDLRRFLEVFRPDILCGQEVGHAAARVLESFFPYGRLEPAIDFRGRAMVAGFDIEPQPVELAWRGGFRARADLDGTPIEVMSAHLANPIDRGTGVPVRKRQVDGLLAALSTLDRGFLVGDMNATPLWPVYRRLRRRLDDGAADWAKRSGRRPPKTWGPFPEWPAMLRIDHVFTRAVEVSSLRVERIAGLDHRAVVADLALPQVRP